MKKRLLWSAGGIIVVVAAIVFFFHGFSRAQPAAVAPANVAPSVKLATARTGIFAVRVSAQGRIGPPAGSSAKVAFPAPGILGSIDVRVGESVGAGQPLAELRRGTLANAVAQAAADARAAAGQYGAGNVPNAGVASARAKVALAFAKLQTLQRGGPAANSNRIAAQSVARQAAIKVATDRATLARDIALQAGGVLAAKDVDAARSQLAADLADQGSAIAKVSAAGADFQATLKGAQSEYATARSELAVAQAQGQVLAAQNASAGAKLSTAELDYANGILKAPSDGVVLAILKHPGEAVDAASPVVEIGPPEGHGVTLSVPADEARHIRVGNPVQLQAQQAGERGTGRVIAVVPSVDPTTQASTVIVSGVPANAVSGDAVTATIVTSYDRGVLVPSSAIVQDPQTGKNVVFVHESQRGKDATFTSREVVLRASDETTAEIASGLHPGESVAAQGGYNLLSPSGA